MVAFRCPHCGADISFDPDQQSMQCEYCGSTITIEDYERAQTKEGYYVTNELSCTQCGAVIYSTDTTMATFCSYCGSSVLLRNRIVQEKKPDYIIPFSVQKEEAARIYRDRVDSILLAPKWMDEDATVEKFRGIYMPFHLLRYSYDIKYTGEGTSNTVEREHGKKYDVFRTYRVEEAPIKAEYDFIPVDASSSFPDNMSRALCPFTKKKLKQFKEPYLAGYYADSSDVPAELYADKYANVIKQSVVKDGKMNIHNVDFDSSDIVNNYELKGEYFSSLLPVWFLSYRNKKRINYAAVNGDTGELVVDIPIDFKKYLGVSLIIAALFSVILNIFLTLTPGKMLFATTFLSFVAFLVANNLLNDTHRRIMHYDDAGYTGVDVDKVQDKARKKNKGKNSHLVLKVVLILFVTGLIGAISEDIPIFGFVGIAFFPVAIAVLFISAARSGSSTRGLGVKVKKAPIYRKILTLIKPIAAMVLGAYVYGIGTVNDMAFYTAAIFSIIMIVLTAFDVVRIQNRYTMRDIPLFTEKRGGE
ncbi:MAG: hypothetical protein IK152_08410 [Lachnospiraceae bacterium]|nr:hypothetical protein [Lachnospiraceae bacterium]